MLNKSDLPMTLDPKKYDVAAVDFYKLDTVKSVVERLGNPQLNQPTILIAGTNGKGSVCHYTSYLLAKTGLRVGSYYSPHVCQRTERIRINLEEISEALLQSFEAEYVHELEPLTYFERMTVLSFLVFRSEKVDVQVIEVGMGGRLDATNLCEPEISVVTSVGADHQDVLGQSYREIAKEKAGIFRSQALALSPAQRSEVDETLRQSAFEIGAHWKKVDCFKENSQWQEPFATNASLAWSAYTHFCEKRGIKMLPWSSVEKELGSVRLPARLQYLRNDPPFLVDGAHNEDAMASLLNFLEREHAAEKFHLICGFMNDKPAEEMLSCIRPYVQKFYLPSFFPQREQAPSTLKQSILKLWPTAEVEVMSDFSKEISELWKQQEACLVVGSFYLAGQCINILRAQGMIKT